MLIFLEPLLLVVVLPKPRCLLEVLSKLPSLVVVFLKSFPFAVAFLELLLLLLLLAIVAIVGESKCQGTEVHTIKSFSDETTPSPYSTIHLRISVCLHPLIPGYMFIGQTKLVPVSIVPSG